jgi:uncharacterized membrane protein required for colicin V production
MAFSWPDVVVAAILVIGALFGFKRGLLNEVLGLIALGFAIVAGLSYSGMWDAWVRRTTHLDPSLAHLGGLVLFALCAYAVVRLLGLALAPVTKLPLLGSLNAALGAVVGLLKAGVFAWVALYVALFFPLPPALRNDFRHSTLVALLATPNPRVDGMLRAELPARARPYAEQLFAAHQL